MSADECCGQAKVRAIYLTSYSGSRKPVLVCRKFAEDHPREFEIVRDQPKEGL